MTARRPAESDWTAVARPVSERGTMPLRVSVYSALARAIRAGDPAPGALLPVEVDLCAAFGVSRTVLREALMLAEEDGLIRTKRGVGRFVADKPPQVGLEQIQPMERLLRDRDQTVIVDPVQRGVEPATAFTARGLDLPESASTTIWESQLIRGGEPVALSQEWIPAGPPLSAVSPRLAADLDSAPATTGTLLALLIDTLGVPLGPASVEVSISTAGAERGEVIGVQGQTPILVLSQTVLLKGRPLYVAKHMLRAEAGHLLVAQSAQA